METKICRTCKIEKEVSFFRQRHNKKRNKIYRNNECIECQRLYWETEEYKNSRKIYYQENKIEINKQHREYNVLHIEEKKERSKLYYQDNKDSIRIVQKQYIKRRRKNDVSFRLGASVSKSINRAIKLNGSLKSGKSTFKYLPYSKKDLKEHLERQFEPWMTWDNYGIYDSNVWNDDDPNTWTWNIDHVIPHSEFKYASMEDNEFKQCWALSNLRPLSAKQNWLEGINRSRHKGDR